MPNSFIEIFRKRIQYVGPNYTSGGFYVSMAIPLDGAPAVKSEKILNIWKVSMRPDPQRTIIIKGHLDFGTK